MKKLLLLCAIFFSILLLSSCTKDFGVSITLPGPDIILSKLMSGRWENVTFTSGGKKMKIAATGLQGDYTFSSHVLNNAAIFKDDGNADNFIFVSPDNPDGLYAGKINKDTKYAIEVMVEAFQGEGGDKILSNFLEQIMKGSGIELKPEDILKDADNLDPAMYKKLLDALSKPGIGMTSPQNFAKQ